MHRTQLASPEAIGDEEVLTPVPRFVSKVQSLGMGKNAHVESAPCTIRRRALQITTELIAFADSNLLSLITFVGEAHRASNLSRLASPQQLVSSQFVTHTETLL